MVWRHATFFFHNYFQQTTSIKLERRFGQRLHKRIVWFLKGQDSVQNNTPPSFVPLMPSAKVPYQAASHIEVSSSIVITWFKLWEFCKSSSPPLLCYGKDSEAHIFLMPSWPSKVSKNEKLWKANIYESPLNHLEPSTSLRQSNIIMRWFHRVIPEIRCKTLCKSIITIMSIHSSYSNCCLNLIGLKAISI